MLRLHFFLEVLFLFVLVHALAASRVLAQAPSTAYRVEDVITPLGIAPEVSAIAFTQGGDLVVAFRLGTVWRRDRDTGAWSLFASGLFWPLGILAGDDGELFIAQVPELTRVVDTDRDGRADLYETVCDQWGLSGNYHEFIAGPVRDSAGRFYLALGCASSGGPVRPPVRGELRPNTRRGEAYGHFSPVPWRGWVVRVETDGSLTPFACGFRQPNGLVLGPEGDLFAIDNQGDWVGTSPIHHVTFGTFHGHPASLVWEPGFEGYPQEVPVAVLDARRKPPAIRLPQNDMAGSIGEPAFDTTAGRFGPYTGQLFVSEWSHARVHRIFLEKVDGVWQGAAFPFLDGDGLRRGSHRIAFGPDGALWLGQVSRLWGGTGEGLQRIEWTGEVPFEILEMRLASRGFMLRLTKPIAKDTASHTDSWTVRHYDYAYHAAYGSPKIDEKLARVESVAVSADGLDVTLVLSGLEAGRVWEVRPRGIRAADGQPLRTKLAAYTLNRLLDGHEDEARNEDDRGGESETKIESGGIGKDRSRSRSP